MATTPKGPAGIHIGKGASNVKIDNYTYRGAGTAVEVHTGATGVKINNISTPDGAQPVRYLTDPVEPRNTSTAKEDPAPEVSSGWNRALEANWPFPKPRG